MVNFNNYNKMTSMPSVHYGRANLAARYEATAANKAAAHLAYSQPSMMFVGYQQPQQRMSTLQKVLTGIQSFVTAFGTSQAVSGNMSNMGGGMGMCGMGNCMSMNGSLFGNRMMY